MIIFYIEHKPNAIGEQLSHHNILFSKGNIRIAKFKNSYNPKKGFGYNLEIYFKILIRFFKKKHTIKKILYQKFFLDNFNLDVLKLIQKYLY